MAPYQIQSFALFAKAQNTLFSIVWKVGLINFSLLQSSCTNQSLGGIWLIRLTGSSFLFPLLAQQCLVRAPSVTGASLSVSRQGTAAGLTYTCTAPGMSFPSGDVNKSFPSLCTCSTTAQELAAAVGSLACSASEYARCAWRSQAPQRRSIQYSYCI